MCYLIQGGPVVSLGGFLSKCLLDVSLPGMFVITAPLRPLVGHARDAGRHKDGCYATSCPLIYPTDARP